VTAERSVKATLRSVENPWKMFADRSRPRLLDKSEIPAPTKSAAMNQSDLEAVAAQLNSSRHDIDEIASSLIKDFKSKTIPSEREESAARLVSQLGYLVFAIGHAVSEHQQFVRARPVPNPNCCFDRATGLHSPPDAIAKRGRANDDGQSLLYASTTLETAMEEIRHQRPDLTAFNTVEFTLKPQQSAHFVVIGEIDHMRRFGRTVLEIEESAESISKVLSALRPDVLRAAQLSDAFFADEFSKPDTGDRGQYAVTHRIAAEFLGDPRIDAVMYPSVAHRGGLNASIRPTSFVAKFQARKFQALAIAAILGTASPPYRSMLRPPPFLNQVRSIGSSHHMGMRRSVFLTLEKHKRTPLSGDPNQSPTRGSAKREFPRKQRETLRVISESGFERRKGGDRRKRKGAPVCGLS
jgi:RES domain-containing protein